jgi:hypothetical protein
MMIILKSRNISMRTKKIKIRGETFKAILICGGKGFKVYTYNGFYIVSILKRNIKVFPSDRQFKAITEYSMLGFYSLESQEIINRNMKKALDQLIE